jgi:hypothetical protein
MTYHCKHCKFTWDFAEGDIQKLLLHEKTHLKEKAISIAGKTA